MQIHKTNAPSERITPLPSLALLVNLCNKHAESCFLSKVFTQRRQEAKAQRQNMRLLSAFPPLRLCVNCFCLRPGPRCEICGSNPLANHLLEATSISLNETLINPLIDPGRARYTPFARVQRHRHSRSFSMDNESIAHRFYQLATLMEVRGDDPFRLRSYRNAAEAIETWPIAVKEIAAKEGVAGLQSIPGVGKAIAGKIIELLQRGTFDAWEKVIVDTPESVLDLLEIPGIGPKTAATLHQNFKVSSLDDLKKFVAGGGLELVDGIGPKTADRIKEALQR